MPGGQSAAGAEAAALTPQIGSSRGGASSTFRELRVAFNIHVIVSEATSCWFHGPVFAQRRDAA